MGVALLLATLFINLINAMPAGSTRAADEHQRSDTAMVENGCSYFSKL